MLHRAYAYACMYILLLFTAGRGNIITWTFFWQTRGFTSTIRDVKKKDNNTVSLIVIIALENEMSWEIRVSCMLLLLFLLSSLSRITCTHGCDGGKEKRKKGRMLTDLPHPCSNFPRQRQRRRILPHPQSNAPPPKPTALQRELHLCASVAHPSRKNKVEVYDVSDMALERDEKGARARFPGVAKR